MTQEATTRYSIPGSFAGERYGIAKNGRGQPRSAGG
jgi:hypothetical protein